ncbi:hypothetical protein [Fervidobacterium nodosum]|uniref:hypothetical protein n=1 Tax=Fervidobacterium nodosum TaxID=2424 RepID=UPI00030943D2|nr:hypothetical protein [Fervidobacterium nodosum]PHJ13830.1 hypothetical protein IM41_04170 [Fervidobacterium sp. SC_NGM5_G05]
MLKYSTSKLYDSLEKETISEFGEEGKDVFLLIWEIFSEYMNISGNEENKFIDKSINLIDNFFENK